MTSEDIGSLAGQSRQPLPEPARLGILAFNRRQFFEQHEWLEQAWRDEPGPVRRLYQGILQVGVACLHIQRRNYQGARKMFQRAWQHLDGLPDVCQGVDVAQLRLDARATQAELERLGADRIDRFDPVFFMKIKVDERLIP